MRGLSTIGLLILSNIFMTFAWYGHLKLQEAKIITHWPLIGVILFSWSIALFEYCAQVPANRLGFAGQISPFIGIPASPREKGVSHKAQLPSKK